jgi:hypothetical protein
MAKRRRKTPVKSFSTSLELQEFIDVEKEWMYNRIVEAIEDSYYRSTDTAEVFEAKIAESHSIIYMRSDREEWTNSLSLALDWYESEEMYEKCSKVLKLINDIKVTHGKVAFTEEPLIKKKNDRT